MQPFLVVYYGISHLSLVFSWYTHSPKRHNYSIQWATQSVRHMHSLVLDWLTGFPLKILRVKFLQLLSYVCQTALIVGEELQLWLRPQKNSGHFLNACNLVIIFNGVHLFMSMQVDCPIAWHVCFAQVVQHNFFERCDFLHFSLFLNQPLSYFL